MAISLPVGNFLYIYSKAWQVCPACGASFSSKIACERHLPAPPPNRIYSSIMRFICVVIFTAHVHLPFYIKIVWPGVSGVRGIVLVRDRVRAPTYPMNGNFAAHGQLVFIYSKTWQVCPECGASFSSEIACERHRAPSASSLDGNFAAHKQ